MKKQDELSNPTSCLNKAADDEPLFVLRGKDPAAAIAICAWIEERIALGKNARDDQKMQDAMNVAVEMEKYCERMPK